MQDRANDSAQNAGLKFDSRISFLELSEVSSCLADSRRNNNSDENTNSGTNHLPGVDLFDSAELNNIPAETRPYVARIDNALTNGNLNELSGVLKELSNDPATLAKVVSNANDHINNLESKHDDEGTDFSLAWNGNRIDLSLNIDTRESFGVTGFSFDPAKGPMIDESYPAPGRFGSFTSLANLEVGPMPDAGVRADCKMEVISNEYRGMRQRAQRGQ